MINSKIQGQPIKSGEIITRKSSCAGSVAESCGPAVSYYDSAALPNLSAREPIYGGNYMNKFVPMKRIMDTRSILKAALALMAGLLLMAGAASCNKDGCIRGKGSMVKEKRDVGGFSYIIAEGSMDVYITEDSFYSVEVEAQSNLMGRLKTEVNGSTLRIYLDGCVNSHKQIKAWVHLPKLTGAELKGSGNINGNNTFNTDKMTLKVDGSGDINLNTNCTDLIARINGSGNIRMGGNAATADYDINGSGNIENYGVTVSNSCNANIDGSGNIKTTVNGILTARVNGSGNIYYKGNPTEVNAEINGSGKIEKR